MTIFDGIKKLFGADAKSPRSASRDALAKINAEMELSREAIAGIESRIAQLKSIIEAGSAAERELQDAVASGTGAAELLAFSTGRDKSGVARHVNNADRAAQAAEVARRALPAAEKDVSAARLEFARLDAAKKAQISTILLEHGDLLAQRYAEKFRELGTMHDQIVGFARGANLSSIILATEPLEAPRFELPSLRCTDTFKTFLRYIPQQQTINEATTVWLRFAERLADDPVAGVSAAIDAVVSSDLLDEAKRHPEHASNVTSWVRERRDDHLSANEVVYGKDQPKVRRKIALG